MIYFIAILLVIGLIGCQSTPPPCNCGKAEETLRTIAVAYGDALEDVGNLRKQLKGCEERHR